jgi:serine/threonine protein kinase
VNWALLPPDLEALIGQTLANRYLVEDVLGVGGMGAVFRGRHLALDRDVAIKVLRPEYAAHPEVSARFDREARAASMFDHPNCVQVVDFGSSDQGLKFMVMQLLEGCGLAAALGRRYPVSQAVEITLEILQGLEHAHGHGVIHRDLKPENVFITRDHTGSVILKLVDFGIAKLVSGRNDGIVTRIGTVFGTPQYMSPEQAAGEEIDERADLYSVGVILYQLVTGGLPFDDADTRELMRKQMVAHPPPLPPYVPIVLATSVGKLLAKRRDFRYPSARDAIVALTSVRRMLPPDRVPRVALLEPAPTTAPSSYAHDIVPTVPQSPNRSPPQQARKAGNLEQVDKALQQVLTNQTPFAIEALREGIHETPASRGWNIDLDNLQLEDIEGSKFSDD